MINVAKTIDLMQIQTTELLFKKTYGLRNLDNKSNVINSQWKIIIEPM